MKITLVRQKIKNALDYFIQKMSISYRIGKQANAIYLLLPKSLKENSLLGILTVILFITINLIFLSLMIIVYSVMKKAILLHAMNV